MQEARNRRRSRMRTDRRCREDAPASVPKRSTCRCRSLRAGSAPAKAHPRRCPCNEAAVREARSPEQIRESSTTNERSPSATLLKSDLRGRASYRYPREILLRRISARATTTTGGKDLHQIERVPDGYSLTP